MKNKKIFLVILFLIAVSFLYGGKASAAPWTSGQCTDAGGTCMWSCDSSLGYKAIGNCTASTCCQLQDTSGADPTATPSPPPPVTTPPAAANTSPASVPPPATNNANPAAAPAANTPATTAPKITTPSAAPANNTASSAASGSGSSPGALVPCGIGAGSANCTLCHLILGFKNIYDYLLVLLLSATILVVVVAGVMYMVSSGGKGMIDKAKSALTYALTAMILALTAWLVVNATLNALGYNKSGSWWTFQCDTTQTKGPTGGTGGGTLPGNTGNPGGTGTGNTGGTGCAAVVNNIKAMDGWAYTSDKLGNNNLRMTDGYGDCSSTTSRAYTNAGCKDPGQSTSAMNGNASGYSGDSSTLKAGDALVWNNGKSGHTGICLNDGCSQIMGATTAGGIHAGGGSAASIAGQASDKGATLKVIKASDFCPASGC